MAVIQAIVAYDVSANDDRARLAAYLSRRGVRLQRSVFQCRIEPDELDRLQRVSPEAAHQSALKRDTLAGTADRDRPVSPEAAHQSALKLFRPLRF